MRKAPLVLMSVAMSFVTAALAGTPKAKIAGAADARKAVQPTDAGKPGTIRILRQDLFDRNNPNNLRSDWHGPPAQPGQF